MDAVLEKAASGRSKCRACGVAIARDELRLGERIANPFGDGQASLWFHPMCAAYRRPQALLAAIEGSDLEGGLAAERVAAQWAASHRRLSRIGGAERASSGRAKCRSCSEPIAKDSWRIKLLFFEDDGRFAPGGFVHASCARAYFETAGLAPAVFHFSVALDSDEQQALVAALTV